MGRYIRSDAYTPNGFPAFTHIENNELHLYCGSPTGRWYIGATGRMLAGSAVGYLRSATPSSSPVGLQWKVQSHGGFGAWLIDTALHVVNDVSEGVDSRSDEEGDGDDEGGPCLCLAAEEDVHSALEEEEGEEVHQKWTRRDGVITSFCAASGEHQIVLSDAARTTHWRRLCHFQFRDWSSLPLTRAAVVRKRLVTTLLMVFNRLIKETVAGEFIEKLLFISF